MNWTYNDGGRADAGYKGTTGDCVCRSIAIATGKSYQEVYDDLVQLSEERYGKRKNRRKTRYGTGYEKISHPRTGVMRDVYQKYLESLGWEWIPTMQIGSGCKTHLKEEELPGGTIIARVSKHVTCVKDGIIQDTYDCSREGTRCVYGYFRKKA